MVYRSINEIIDSALSVWLNQFVGTVNIEANRTFAALISALREAYHGDQPASFSALSRQLHTMFSQPGCPYTRAHETMRLYFWHCYVEHARQVLEKKFDGQIQKLPDIASVADNDLLLRINANPLQIEKILGTVAETEGVRRRPTSASILDYNEKGELNEYPCPLVSLIVVGDALQQRLYRLTTDNHK